MSEDKPTVGPWVANCFLVVAPKVHDQMSGVYGGAQICHTGGVGRSGGECESNAQLIADAGTVFHDTGLTPSQLAADRSGLLVSCQVALRVIDRLYGQQAMPDDSAMPDVNSIRAVIESIANRDKS